MQGTPPRLSRNQSGGRGRNKEKGNAGGFIAKGIGTSDQRHDMAHDNQSSRNHNSKFTLFLTHPPFCPVIHPCKHNSAPVVPQKVVRAYHAPDARAEPTRGRRAAGGNLGVAGALGTGGEGADARRVVVGKGAKGDFLAVERAVAVRVGHQRVGVGDGKFVAVRQPDFRQGMRKESKGRVNSTRKRGKGKGGGAARTRYNVVLKPTGHVVSKQPASTKTSTRQ